MMLFNENDVKTHRTPKALRAKYSRNLFPFAKASERRARPHVALTFIFVALTATLCGEELPRNGLLRSWLSVV